MIVGMTPSFMQGMGLSKNATSDGLPLYLGAGVELTANQIDAPIFQEQQAALNDDAAWSMYDWKFDWKIYTAIGVSAVALYWLLKKK